MWMDLIIMIKRSRLDSCFLQYHFNEMKNNNMRSTCVIADTLQSQTERVNSTINKDLSSQMFWSLISSFESCMNASTLKSLSRQYLNISNYHSMSSLGVLREPGAWNFKSKVDCRSDNIHLDHQISNSYHLYQAALKLNSCLLSAAHTINNLVYRHCTKGRSNSSNYQSHEIVFRGSSRHKYCMQILF
jgi:hypothetical protein